MIANLKTVVLLAFAATAALAAPVTEDRGRTVHLIQLGADGQNYEVASCSNASRRFVHELKASRSCLYGRRPGQDRTCFAHYETAWRPFQALCKQDGEYANYFELPTNEKRDVYLTRTADFKSQVQVCKGADLNRLYPQFALNSDVCNEWQAGTKEEQWACINSFKGMSQEKYRQTLAKFRQLCWIARGRPQGITQA